MKEIITTKEEISIFIKLLKIERSMYFSRKKSAIKSIKNKIIPAKKIYFNRGFFLSEFNSRTFLFIFPL